MFQLNSAIYPLELQNLDRSSNASHPPFALHIDGFVPQQQPQQSGGALEGYYLVVGGIQWDNSLYVEGFSIDPLANGEVCPIHATTPRLKRAFLSLWQGDVDKMTAVAGMTVDPHECEAIFSSEGIQVSLTYHIEGKKSHPEALSA